jgi:hypothetical protein
MFLKNLIILLVVVLSAAVVNAHEADEAIPAEASESIEAEFDVVYARVARFGSNLLFQQVVSGAAGTIIPEAGNNDVYSYVWPTSLDSAVVGFEPEQGILALAVTAHPDFDDTPLVDENEDGDNSNDGDLWHSHWVVLVQDESCEGGLKVKDIPEGETPAVPETWPELPILIDSPNYALELVGSEVVVTVPHEAVGFAEEFNFDGVTAGLRVNANLHDPLLCVVGVDDVASGDLSLPGVAR